MMQQEVTALQSEWNRIIESTKYNGMQLLTGTETRLLLQGMEGDSGTLAVQFGEEQLAGGVAGYVGGATRVSAGSSGSQARGSGSYGTAISADGRYVAFWSGAADLVAGDTNGWRDSFLKDLTKTGVNQLSGLVVSNRVSAGVSLMLTARAREELTVYRARLGTALTRIDSFVNTLSTATINLQEAAARITDADIAEEASRLMAARMRQEVATNLLRQTNLQPSLALLLLKG